MPLAHRLASPLLVVAALAVTAPAQQEPPPVCFDVVTVPASRSSSEGRLLSGPRVRP